MELSEDNPVTREVIAAGQENYYYFQGESNVAYDIYCESALDTQATEYDENKNRIAYDDNSGLNNNFMFTGTFSEKRFFKVSVKNGKIGAYTIYAKKRFTVPNPTGVRGQDKYTISWNPIEHAKEYLVTIYDSTGKIGESVVTGTSYDYVYNSATVGKTLGFTVTARENSQISGETSRMIFNTSSQSEWVYDTAMPSAKKNASGVVVDEKFYVLGGEGQNGCQNDFLVYDTAKKTWEELENYPGSETICNAAMAVLNNEIYVIGGQTDTTGNAKLLNQIYAYQIETRQWQKKKELPEGRSNLSIAVSNGKIYLFSQIGTTHKISCYNPKADSIEDTMLTGISDVISAMSIDDRVFVLKETDGKMCIQEYLPDEEVYGEEGEVCPYAKSEPYKPCAVMSGKIYMMKETDTNQVLSYDSYTDTWSEISPTNLKKKNALLLSSGNLKKDHSQIVTLLVDPKKLEIKKVSSFAQEEELREGMIGVTLLEYKKNHGRMVLELEPILEQGISYETYQSVPVIAKADGTVEVKISLSEKE